MQSSRPISRFGTRHSFFCCLAADSVSCSILCLGGRGTGGFLRLAAGRRRRVLAYFMNFAVLAGLLSCGRLLALQSQLTASQQNSTQQAPQTTPQNPPPPPE